MKTIQKYWLQITEFALPVAYALLTLIVGFWVISLLTKAFGRVIDKRTSGVEGKSLNSFLKTLFNAILKVLLFVTVASRLGVETTSLAAVIGAAGLAIGLSLQGSLSNLAGGVLILILKPFKVGEFIEVNGHSGTVKEIQIFYTHMNTVDNKLIIMPNGSVSNASLTNYSREPIRRIGHTIGVGYDADLKQTKDILMEILKRHELVLEDPEPAVVLTTLNTNSVDFAMRGWVKAEDYWGVFSELLEEAKLELDKAGIDIPYPQRVVHMKKED